VKRTTFRLALLQFAAVLFPIAQSSSPVFPFGAVYFRKSNPPEQDWERDHKTAAQMGVNIFRHWFMWASIENAPGKYDWRDYNCRSGCGTNIRMPGGLSRMTRRAIPRLTEAECCRD
jgi:hypothetical protein